MRCEPTRHFVPRFARRCKKAFLPGTLAPFALAWRLPSTASFPKAVLSVSEPAITITHGALPPFPPRRAAFVANLLSLFYGNREETELLREKVGQIESYGGRLIPILNLLFPGGTPDLVLEKAPEETLNHYLQDELGLSLPNIVTLEHDDYLAIVRRLRAGKPLEELAAIPERLATHQLDCLHGYVTDPDLSILAEYCSAATLSTEEGSRKGNNKWLLHDHLEKEGLPVFDTVMVDSPDAVPTALRQLRDQGYARAVLKSQVGASGIGIHAMDTHGSVDPVPDLFFFEGPCMLQGWLAPGHGNISAVYSPSVQLYLEATLGVFLYDLTEQILDEASIHEGNVAPPPHFIDRPAMQETLYEQAAVAGRWLHDQGYRGTASVDFLVTETTDGSMQAYVCEINARVTGATYPAVLARHFQPKGAWLMRNLRFRQPQAAQSLLSLLDDHGHLFRPGMPAGILPINLNADPSGRIVKGQFLCLAATIPECERYLHLGEEDLPVTFDFERD